MMDCKISRGILARVFDNVPRHLQTRAPRTLAFSDFVWYFLAEKDRMTSSSIVYWFRCLDIDGDGYLSKSDLETCYAMKVLS